MDSGHERLQRSCRSAVGAWSASGWAVAVALPRSLITSSARVSPTQLAVAFALAVLGSNRIGRCNRKNHRYALFELVEASTKVAKGDLDVNVREQAKMNWGC